MRGDLIRRLASRGGVQPDSAAGLHCVHAVAVELEVIRSKRVFW
jgi:hypothetical protein